MSVPTISDSCVEHRAGSSRIIHPAQAENDAGVVAREPQGLWLDDRREVCGGLCLDRVEFVKRDLSVLEGPYSKNKTC